jgi:monoamine oxidase
MAAKILKEENIDFMILESTDHVGGRAQTLKGQPHIEFGPEFLHGETPLTDELLEKYEIPYYDMKFDYHLYKNGKLEKLNDFWERICNVMKDIKIDGHDLPFAEYLSKFDHHSKEDQEIAKSFVQGFDAADLNNVSTKTLGEMKEVVCDPSVRKMRRPLHGYGELMERMSDEIFSHILFNYVVEEIEWKKHHVIVRGTIGKENIPFECQAEKVIDTVSVGVLHKQHIQPRPQALNDFLDKVEMGQVVKMVADLDKEFFGKFEGHSFPFIASPDLSFTAWWTTTPIHTTTVTAWAGGEKARELTKLSEDERKDVFIRELAQVTSIPEKDLRSWVKVIHHHDWNKDPSFLGAYSYPKVHDGEDKETETVFEDTLFFAGEAFHEEFSGTIEGALLTGRDAAEKIYDKTR